MTGHDLALLKSHAFIAGEWMEADSQATVTVLNPLDQSQLGTVPLMGASETRRAINAAADAQRDWAMQSGRHRAGLLRKLHDALVSNCDELATIMTLEQGKPIQQARDEVIYGASYLEWYAEEAPRIAGQTMSRAHPDKHLEVLLEPIGVTAAITPWNFPVATVARKLAPALAAGCAQIIKPAPTTPFCALAIAALAEQVGFPSGLISVITGDAAAIGGELTANSSVRMLTFTGSTAVGKLLYKQCSGTVKKLALELGGNAAFIVFSDADLSGAVDGLMSAKFRNMGQVCIAPNRVLVHSSVFDQFAQMLTERVREQSVGPGLDGYNQGPLATAAGFEKVCNHVTEALAGGACALVGGRRHSLGGWFYEPTVLIGVPENAAMTIEETFGPVVALYSFKTEEEAISIANATPYGLAGYFYTRDEQRLRRVARLLQAGIVGANTGLVGSPAGPFGGIKESGIGREGGQIGLEEFMEAKFVCRPAA